ncbi:MAG: PorV/PorQ family protein [Candidatus Eisenbacteria bacterium]|uniref:PorV/PorQ family protein n=1 Tax=Eiseniibacteriota bacterium TaxID=2212470 RepID=A0A933SH75_UNCEI|nr:PorV/PorQ family protein [Candidatus Eisenbacteria bacterium]
MSRFPTLATLAVLATLTAATAQAAPAGFAFLEVPATARAAAMGGAYSAVADGVEASFWNPAGLAGVQGTQFSATHIESFEGLKHDQFALAGRMWGGSLAGSVRTMYSQPIEERDDLGNLVGSFGAHDLEFQAAYGRAFGARWRAGFGAQAVRERLASEAATTWSGSAGVTWDPAMLRGTRLALVATHLGPAANYVIDGQRGGDVALPMAVQAGASWNRSAGHGLDCGLALDTRFARGRQGVVALGGELRSTTGAALRLGWRANDDVANVSAGLGVRLGRANVDYAWVPSKLDLEDTHRFSFGLQF